MIRYESLTPSNALGDILALARDKSLHPTSEAENAALRTAAQKEEEKAIRYMQAKNIEANVKRSATPYPQYQESKRLEQMFENAVDRKCLVENYCNSAGIEKPSLSIFNNKLYILLPARQGDAIMEEMSMNLPAARSISSNTTSSSSSLAASGAGVSVDVAALAVVPAPADAAAGAAPVPPDIVVVADTAPMPLANFKKQNLKCTFDVNSFECIAGVEVLQNEVTVVCNSQLSTGMEVTIVLKKNDNELYVVQKCQVNNASAGTKCSATEIDFIKQKIVGKAISNVVELPALTKGTAERSRRTRAAAVQDAGLSKHYVPNTNYAVQANLLRLAYLHDSTLNVESAMADFICDLLKEEQKVYSASLASGNANSEKKLADAILEKKNVQKELSEKKTRIESLEYKLLKQEEANDGQKSKIAELTKNLKDAKKSKLNAMQYHVGDKRKITDAGGINNGDNGGSDGDEGGGGGKGTVDKSKASLSVSREVLKGQIVNEQKISALHQQHHQQSIVSQQQTLSIVSGITAGLINKMPGNDSAPALHVPSNSSIAVSIGPMPVPLMTPNPNRNKFCSSCGHRAADAYCSGCGAKII